MSPIFMSPNHDSRAAMGRHAVTKTPFLKFFTSDWRADPRLRMCSAAARGLWIEMICLMHEATPYGHLLVNGRPPTDDQLAALSDIPAEEIPPMLCELEVAGVFVRTKTGVVYSPTVIAWNNRSGGRPAIPEWIRRAVWGRDGNVCVYCGTEDGPFHLDHVTPWVLGGRHSVKNLVVACAQCNRSKGAKPINAWAAKQHV